ncbi:MAG: hypothetical protein JNK02_02585 [Planctomycetes bacterium]|nr:hypothetical protein [Planctomycetota bacterium]
MSRRSWVLGLLLAGATIEHASAGERDVRELLEGVRTLGKAGVPGRVAAFGPDSFAVIVGDVGGGARAPVVVAGRAGRARLVAFGHDGYFGEVLGEGDGWRLFENALRWAADRPKGRLQIGVIDSAAFTAALVKRGLAAENVTALERLEKTPPLDVLVGDLKEWSDADLARIDRFLDGGGGIVAGETGWGWQQLNPGKLLLRDNGGNRVARRFGIAWTDGTVEPGEGERFVADARDLAWCHAPSALDALAAKSPPAGFGPREAAIAAWSVAQAAALLPEDDKAFRPRLSRLLLGRAPVVPSAEQPLAKERVLERLQLAIECDAGLAAPPTKAAAHPAAAAFPGEVPSKAPRVQRIVDVPLGVPRWRSTGLYAAPGEVVEVTIARAVAARGLRLRIGCHQDDIAHHDAWRRAPRITREVALDVESVKVANPFGGLVYVVVPGPGVPETVQVKLKNVVEAPRFTLGTTEPSAWRERIRALHGPWAELETDRIVLTIPSSVARAIDDPTAVLERWNVAMDSAADLAGIPRKRPSPERFVSDVQISAGYMHSGYPIMAHLDAAEFVSSPERLCVDGWGPFHEVGHNHQVGAWTFEGTGEVTCNLFTLYALEVACGKQPQDDPRFTAEARTQRWKEQKDRGDAFARWKSDPFLALLVYVDVQQEFGWDLYKRVFREYAAMQRSELPGNDLARRDEWLVRVSRAAGKDLGPLFTSWGLETSPEARRSLGDLSVWLPDGRQ